jgi:hypothetical protein
MNAKGVPVLAYHSMNIAGNAYATNDHIALTADLEELHRAGFEVVPLRAAFEAANAGSSTSLRRVALTFDDGSWFDWHDLEHPAHGPQRSFANILRDFSSATGAHVHATSFVIVDPESRMVLDRTCMIGRGWWGHDWWRAAESEGIMDIESHSWDHNHDTLPAHMRRDAAGGRFDHIDSETEAARQVAQSVEWLNQNVCQRRSRFVAWPYGQSTEFLRKEWMPRFAARLGILGAFGTFAAPLTCASNRWDLPRYVCGRDWRTPSELLSLLIN